MTPKKEFWLQKKWLAYFVTLGCANLFALKSGSLNTSTQYKMISADDDLTVSENWRYVTTRYLWQGPPNNTMAFKVRLKLIFSRLNKTFVLFWQKFPPTPFTNCIKALQCFIQVDLVISLWIDSTRKRTLPRKKQDKLGSSEILNFLRGMTPRTRIVVLWSSLTFDVQCFNMVPHFFMRVVHRVTLCKELLRSKIHENRVKIALLFLAFFDAVKIKFQRKKLRFNLRSPWLKWQ